MVCRIARRMCKLGFSRGRFNFLQRSRKSLYIHSYAHRNCCTINLFSLHALLLRSNYSKSHNGQAIPYSLKFSRLKNFAVFAGYGDTTKILSREIFTHAKRFMGVAICPCASARRPSIAYRVYASAHRL